MSASGPIHDDLAARLHAAPGRGVVVLTSGGSGGLATLLRTPGASRTVLDAQIPYGERALVAFLGGRPDQACAPDTARAMAMAAFHRARMLETDTPVFGLSCTASLATDRSKRGEHRIHVAVQTASRSDLFSVDLIAGARNRNDEEAICDRLLLNAAAEAKGVTPGPAPEWLAGETLAELRCHAPLHWQELVLGERQVTEARENAVPETASTPRLIFPGAFNPVHAGHLGMARLAEAHTGRKVEFELCIRNVDKPPLNYAAIRERLAHLPETSRVWLTATPTFAAKASAFPGATFIVGIDTLERIADPRYYGGDPETRDRAVAHIAAADGGFLVFGRRLDAGFVGLDDVSLPDNLRALCTGIAETEFRHDVSSSELRRGQPRHV